MSAQTKFDLDQTAATAALQVVDKDSFTQESMKLESFTAAGNDPVDFDDYATLYQSHLTTYKVLKNQATKSALKTKAAATAAAAAATTTKTTTAATAA